LFICGRAKCLSRDRCVGSRVAALCSSCSLQNISNSYGLNEAGDQCDNEETYNHESRTPYISLVTALFTVFAQQGPEHLTWGLLRVCAACPTPRLNLNFELRPSWNNIHDTFPTGTARDKVKVIPLQAWTAPEGSRRLRLPDFKTVGT
jgi:hypothetical protein